MVYVLRNITGLSVHMTHIIYSRRIQQTELLKVGGRARVTVINVFFGQQGDLVFSIAQNSKFAEKQKSDDFDQLCMHIKRQSCHHSNSNSNVYLYVTKIPLVPALSCCVKVH